MSGVGAGCDLIAASSAALEGVIALGIGKETIYLLLLGNSALHRRRPIYGGRRIDFDPGSGRPRGYGRDGNPGQKHITESRRIIAVVGQGVHSGRKRPLRIVSEAIAEPASPRLTTLSPPSPTAIKHRKTNTTC